jgi:hypothetical protein
MPKPKPHGFGTAEERSADKACALVEEVGTRIVAEFGSALDQRDMLKITRAPRRKLIPPRR